MPETKQIYQSMTIMGAVIVIISFVVNRLNIDISNKEVVDVVSAVFVIGGALISIIGRIRANKRIGKK